LTQAITSSDRSGNDLFKVALGGVATGIITPLLPYLIDRIAGAPGDFRIALVAIPFAVLVFILVRRFSADPWWAALIAAIVTVIAFVGAVNAAVWIDGQANGAGKGVRNILASLAGGFTGATIMRWGWRCSPPARATYWRGCRWWWSAPSQAHCWRSTMRSSST
jgi:hypothetical protein